MKIPVYKPSLGQEEKDNVIKCLDTGWISSRGHFVEEFEKKFCKLNQIGFSASVCNGTVALHVALVALGIGPGDEVISVPVSVQEAVPEPPKPVLKSDPEVKIKIKRK